MTASVELVGTPTLDRLAETANSEYRAMEDAVSDAFCHAVKVGEALLSAHALVPAGEWQAWLSTNFTSASRETASCHMRIAEHQDMLRDQGIGQVVAAVNYLRERGISKRISKRSVVHHKPFALALRANGLSYRQISEQTGVNINTIVGWVNPESAERQRRSAEKSHRRSREAKKAIEVQRRESAIKRALVKEGQAFNEVYAMLTRMDDLLGQARNETEDREKRAVISEMHALRNKMRDMAHSMLGVS